MLFHRVYGFFFLWGACSNSFTVCHFMNNMFSLNGRIFLKIDLSQNVQRNKHTIQNNIKPQSDFSISRYQYHHRPLFSVRRFSHELHTHTHFAWGNQQAMPVWHHKKKTTAAASAAAATKIHTDCKNLCHLMDKINPELPLARLVLSMDSLFLPLSLSLSTSQKNNMPIFCMCLCVQMFFLLDLSGSFSRCFCFYSSSNKTRVKYPENKNKTHIKTYIKWLN